MRALVAFLSGLLFAAGLGISQMTDPNKVIAFLDVFGGWDPSLAFVMVGAIVAYGVPAWFAQRRSAPVLDDHFHLTSLTEVDARLVGGSALFGIGWGLGGYCPGPALVATSAGGGQALLFSAAMVVGMLLFQLSDQPEPALHPEPEPS